MLAIVIFFDNFRLFTASKQKMFSPFKPKVCDKTSVFSPIIRGMESVQLK